MYNEYKNIDTEITLYLLLSINETEKGDEDYRTTYHCRVGGEYRQLSKSQYNELVEQAKEGKGWWAKLKDAISDFVDFVKDLVDEVVEAIKEFLGFYIKVDHSWAAVVTEGNAYDYVIKQDYTIGYDEMTISTTQEELKKGGERDAETFKVKEEVCDQDGNCKDEEVSYKVWATTTGTYQQTEKMYYHELEYGSSNIEPYEEKTRYQWMFNKVVQENDFKYTEDDVAMAIEVITAYCSEEYGLLGGATHNNFVLAGEMNDSIVQFATQFEGKKLAYMMSIDDTGIFFSNEWCAMFVSYCMKKAGVPIPTYRSCTSFWNKYKDQPGFYDIAPSENPRNGGYITSDPNHRASYKNIQKGDILIWRWNSAKKARSHTGLVVAVDKDEAGNVTCITTVEGNTSSPLGSKGYPNTCVNIKKYYPGKGSFNNIVSFVSISEVLAEYAKGNKWKGVE